MPGPKLEPLGGFRLDVWCDPKEEFTALKAELVASTDDTRRSALLLYELGRIALAEGQEVNAAQYLLKAYTLRPQFRPTLRLARQLYRHRDAHVLALKLLDAEARATRDPLTRGSLLRQQARLVWTQMGDLGRAREILEEAQRLDPADVATLKLLELFSSIDGDAAGRQATVLRLIEGMADERLRVALLVDLGFLAAETDPATAVQSLAAADRASPGELVVLVALEQLHEQARQYVDQARVLERQADLPGLPPALAARLLARAARLYREVVGDADAAVRAFRRSLELAPDFGVAADAFELLWLGERPAEAAEVGELLFSLERHPGFAAGLACHVADLYRLSLGRADAAAVWYRRALETAPSYQPALEGLAQILEATGQVDELLAVHRAELLAVTDPRARAQRLFRVAVLLERHGRTNEALEAHREAVTAWPGYQASVTALERLFTRLERWEELLQLYDQELSHELDAQRRIHLFETMASVWYHHLQQPEQAIDCYLRALALAPTDLGMLRAAARLCAEALRWHDLAELTEREVELIGDSQRRTELLHRIGEIWEDQLLDLDQAVACYRRALAVSPEYLPSLRALGRIYRQRGHWRELIEMHEAEILASTDPDQISSLYYAVAQIYEEELLDEARAAETYRVLLDRQPDYHPAIAALARLLERRGEWAELTVLLEGTLDGAADGRAKALRLWQIGALKEERLGDPSEALRDYFRSLRLCPTLAPPQASVARLLEEQGDHSQLFEHLGTSLEHATSPRQRSSLCLQLADLADRHAGQPRKAAQLYERAMESEPNVWTLWSVLQLYQRLELRRETIDTLERLAGTVRDDRAAAELELRVGRLREEFGYGDPVPHYAKSLGLKSGRIYAQRAMERLLRDAGAAAELADLLLGRIQATKEPFELACLWTELAEVQLRLGQPGPAEQAYREALEHSKGHWSALHGLELLCEDQGRWAELAELAELEGQSLESSDASADAFSRAAELYEERLGEPDRAIPLYQTVLQLQPEHPRAFRRLQELLRAREDWEGLAALLQGQIAATQDTTELLPLYVELGRLLLEQLQQRQKGIACLRRVLEIDPYHVFALVTLGDLYFERHELAKAESAYSQAEGLVGDAEERLRLRRRLGELYTELGQPRAALDALLRAAQEVRGVDPWLLRQTVEAAAAACDYRAQVAALERLADHAEDEAERIRLRKELAELAEERLEDDERAVSALQEVLVLDPLDLEATERLAAIHGRRGNRSAVAEHLQAAVAHHRAELARRPFDDRLYHQMARIFRWQRQFDRLYCACVVLERLGALDEVEHQFLVDHRTRCGELATGGLSPERYLQLVVPHEARGALRDLLQTAGPSLQRIVATDPERYGISRHDRVAEDDPLHEECASLARLVGSPAYELWTSPGDPELVTVEMFAKPALILGSRLAAGPLGAGTRYRLGRALFFLSEHALILRDRSVREIRGLLATLIRVALPDQAEAQPGAEDAEYQAEEVKRIAKLLGRKDRRILAQAIEPIVQALPTVNAGSFARALSCGANRAGLLAAGDPQLGLEEAAALMGNVTSAELGDLLQYVVSEEYFAARQEVGLAPAEGTRR
ncbi:MAG: tetratricopeptide repeat protein [Deltaproteobacteria bacterium]|nr:tetratricopeptide repeat protein [Deltaproteobacteria bacterium]